MTTALSDWLPDFEGAWVDHARIGFGQNIYCFFERSFIGPIGFVWGSFTDDAESIRRFNVAGCYVIEFARRKGILKFMLDKIMEDNELAVLVTDYGSDNGGAAFMQAEGWKKERGTGLWYYRKGKPYRAGRKK
jgi:hypothetical protein